MVTQRTLLMLLAKMPFRVIAFDPGGTTGVCEIAPANAPRSTPNASPIERIESYQIRGDHNTQLLEIAHTIQSAYASDQRLNQPNTLATSTIVVCEWYTIYPHKLQEHVNSDVPTLRLIGLIEYLCLRHSLTLVKHSAANMKRNVPLEVLKAFGLHQPNQTHANDATRHAILYLYGHTNRIRAANHRANEIAKREAERLRGKA